MSQKTSMEGGLSNGHWRLHDAPHRYDAKRLLAARPM
jgi:hypothetical protein